MTTTRERKKETASKYFDILNSVYTFGNKVMYKSLLFEVCEKFNLVRNKTHFNKIIKELEDDSLIRIETYTRGKAIILKKGSLAIIENKSSKNISGVSSKIVHNRLKNTTLRIKYMLIYYPEDIDLDKAMRSFKRNLALNVNDYKSFKILFEKNIQNIYRNLINNKLSIEKIASKRTIDFEYNRLAINEMIISEHLNSENKSKKILKDESFSISYQISNSTYLMKSTVVENSSNTNFKRYTIKFKIAIFIATDKIYKEKLTTIIRNTRQFYRSLFNLEDTNVNLVIEYDVITEAENAKKIFKRDKEIKSLFNNKYSNEVEKTLIRDTAYISYLNKKEIIINRIDV